MKIVEPAQAVASIPDSSTVIFPGACANPVRFYDAFAADVERFSRLTVCSALSFGDYPFLQRGLGRHFRYLTWHASPAIRHLFKEGDREKIGFVPIRLSELTRVVCRDGPISPDVVVVQTSMPQDDGSVSNRLGEIKGANLFSGMLSQGLISYLETVAHTPKVIIDLQGQANGETLGPVQISGVGGSLDYIEGAWLSAGGKSILALPATTAGDKHSKIVAALTPGGVVTTPRYCADYVVTEYGIAHLRGKDLWQRAEALIAIAHPAFRDELAGSLF